MEQLVERAYSTFNEEARRRGIDYRNELQRAAGAHHRRRPRPPDHHEPPVERVPLDARRRPIALGLAAGERDGRRCRSTDTGPGIALDEQERIFRPFWSRDGGGTGLGLAIASELAQALGGRIELDTELGQGSAASSSSCRATRDRAREPAQVVELRPRRGSRWRATVAALRPRQWPKNLLLFAGILFAAKLGDVARSGSRRSRSSSRTARRRARRTSSTTCATLEHDRAHPVKRDRPIARGELPPDRALVLAAVLGAVARRRSRRCSDSRRCSSCSRSSRCSSRTASA